MSQVVDIEKVTIGPKDFCARVVVLPQAPALTSEDPEGTERVKRLMPELIDHVCMGDAGSRFGDAIDDTELPHLLEHMTVELLALTNLADDVSCGRTYPVEGETDAYDVVFPCPDDVLVATALSSAQWIMEWAYTGGGEPEPDVDAIVGGIVALMQGVAASEAADAVEAEDEAELTEGEQAALHEELAEEDEAADAEEAEAEQGEEAAVEGVVEVAAEEPVSETLELAEEDVTEAESEDGAPAEEPVPDWGEENGPRPRPVR